MVQSEEACWNKVAGEFLWKPGSRALLCYADSVGWGPTAQPGSSTHSRYLGGPWKGQARM